MEERTAGTGCGTNTQIQDLNLPKSITQRLAKGMLPPNTQIQKDAVLAMSKSATVFVNYVTSQYDGPHSISSTPFLSLPLLRLS